MSDYLDLARVRSFMIQAHGDQKRRYTNEPYWTHPIQVAGLVSTAVGFLQNRTVMVATALLHDVVEDCSVDRDMLFSLLGDYKHTSEIVQGVILLSDINQTGTRKEKLIQTNERLATAPPWVQTVKVCDIISNISTIHIHAPKFAAQYCEEKLASLNHLQRANPELLEMAYDFVS